MLSILDLSPGSKRTGSNAGVARVGSGPSRWRVGPFAFLALWLIVVLVRSPGCVCLDPIVSIGCQGVTDVAADGDYLALVRKSWSQAYLRTYGLGSLGEPVFQYERGLVTSASFSVFVIPGAVVVYRTAVDGSCSYDVYRNGVYEMLAYLGSVPSEPGGNPAAAMVQDVLCTANPKSVSFTRLTGSRLNHLDSVPHSDVRLCRRQREHQLVALSNDTIFVYEIQRRKAPRLSQTFRVDRATTDVIPDPDNLFLVSRGGIRRCRTQGESLVVQAEAPWPGGDAPDLRFIGATDSLLFFRSARGDVALDVGDRDRMRWCGLLPWSRCVVDPRHNTAISLERCLQADSLIVFGLDCRLPDLDLRGETLDDPLPLTLVPGLPLVVAGSTDLYRADFTDCDACACHTWYWHNPNHYDWSETKEWHAWGNDVCYQFTTDFSGRLDCLLTASYNADVAILGPTNVLACGPGPHSLHLDPGTYTLVVDGTYGEVHGGSHNGDWSSLTHDSSGRYALTLNWMPETSPLGQVTPSGFLLGEPAPNPFNPATRLDLTLSIPTPVRAEIVDLAGRRVRLLEEGVLPAGSHALHWDGRSESGAPAASGLYLAVVAAGGEQRTRKLLLLR